MTRRVEKGRRVHLRRPRAADLEAFLAAVRRSRSLHRPWVAPPASEQAFRKYLTRACRDNRSYFLICPNGEDAIAGVVNLSEIVRGALQSTYLGFYAMKGYEGRGLMTEGVSLALRHAFRSLRLHRVEANVQPANHRSIALLRRCGFRKEGVSPRYLKIGGRWRDHERWARLRDDPAGDA